MTKASGKLEEHLSISQQIAEQQKLEGTAKEHFAPVTVPIVAKAHQLVYSTANVKDGISKKVTIVHLSDLTKEKFEQLLT